MTCFFESLLVDEVALPMNRVIFLIGLALILYWSNAFAFGPFDYTNPEHNSKKLPIVEQYHFNSDVEALRKGMSATVGGDIAYVLKAFPNHHRALNAMSRLWRRHMQKGQIPPGLDRKQSPEYWFEKAMVFAPRDAMVRLLYGIHLYRLNKLDEAIKICEQALELQSESTEIHYNLGLLYLKKGNYSRASRHAEKAYEFGYPLPWLKNKLIEAGRWHKNDAP